MKSELIKRAVHFLAYNNATVVALGLVLIGGSAFAATTAFTPENIPPVPSVFSAIASASEPMDASILLSADLAAFDFGTKITGVSETDAQYVVNYSLQTLAPEDGAWRGSERDGSFSVGKDALGDGGLAGYAREKLLDIENGERAYLARAKEAEQKIADERSSRPANAFAGLVGLSLDQIPEPVVVKPMPEPVPDVALPISAPSVVMPESTSESVSVETTPSALSSTEGAATTTQDIISVATTSPSDSETGSSDATSSTPPEGATSVTL